MVEAAVVNGQFSPMLNQYTSDDINHQAFLTFQPSLKENSC